jgi:hypothetical protein
VVVIDPCDLKWVVSFNPLEAIQGMPVERTAAFLTDVVVKIWGLNATNTPRLVWLLTNTFMALSALGLSLLDLPRFLLDHAFRSSLLTRLPLAGTRAYFEFEFPKSQGAMHQWITPVLNKIGSLIFDPDIRLLVAGKRTINFRDLIDKKRVLLVHLPKGILGEGSSALLGAFIVAHLQKAALSRANVGHRPPYYLYLDEFQNYTTDNITDVLSESRKYALSLTLAHQYLEQLKPELRHAVLNTTGTLASFRVSYHDGFPLAKEIFPASDFLTTRQTSLRLRRFWRWPVIQLSTRDEGLGWEGLAHELAGLPHRQFWVRRRGPGAPVKLQTLAMPDPVLTPELSARVQLLRQTAGTAYGRAKQAARRETDTTATWSAAAFDGLPGHSNGSRVDGDIPFWGD